MSKAGKAAGVNLAQARLTVRVLRLEAGSVWMTPGLTFQYAGEDADCTEGSLPLSWLLEAVHTRSLGVQHLRPAWLLRRCGLGVTGRYASAWGRGSAWIWGSCPRLRLGRSQGASMGVLMGHWAWGFFAPNSLPANNSPLANHYLLHSLFFLTISH